MSNYTKSTNFATKDNLSPGDPLKVVRGTEIDTEFNNISTAIATKTDNSAAAITGGTISGITDLAIADGGTGASTATAALNNLLPSQTSAANKYLQSDGTNASWDAVTLSTADITGTLAVANGGTGVTSSTGTGSVVLSNSPTLVTPALGTPSALVGTNITGTASGLTAGSVTTNANLTGAVTSVGNATSLGSFTSSQLATALTDETGSGSAVFATSPTLVTPALGTPSALVGTNITGTAANFNINGTVGATTANTGNFTTLTTSSTVTLNGGTANGVTYLNGSKVLTSGATLTYGGSGGNLAVGANGTAGNFETGAGGYGYLVSMTNVGSKYAIRSVNNTDKELYINDSAGGFTKVITYVDGSEGMRLTSTGLGIGTSSITAKLKVQVSAASAGFEVTDASTSDFVITPGVSSGVCRVGPGSGAMAFYTANSERARIDTSGNLLVGTTSILAASAAGSVHIVGGVNSPNEGPLSLRNPASTAGQYWTTGPTNNGGYVIFNASTVGQYMSYGATAWTATSDERFKTAITPFSNAIDKVLTLRAGTGRYLTDDENVSRSFLIAQDVQKVLPEAIDEQNDELKTLGLRYAEVIPLLVAAIQELKVENNSLKARLDAANL